MVASTWGLDMPSWKSSCTRRPIASLNSRSRGPKTCQTWKSFLLISPEKGDPLALQEWRSMQMSQPHRPLQTLFIMPVVHEFEICPLLQKRSKKLCNLSKKKSFAELEK